MALMRWLRRILAFAAAVATTGVLASFASSHFVLLGLTGLGVEITLADRLAMAWRDVLGIGSILTFAFGIALLVGLPLAALGVRLLPAFPGHRLCGYALAGGLAVVAALLVLEASLGVMPLAGARTLPGLLAQAFAGIVGGAVFTAIAGDRPGPNS